MDTYAEKPPRFRPSRILQHVLERGRLHHGQSRTSRASNQKLDHHHYSAGAELSMHAKFGLLSPGPGNKVYVLRKDLHFCVDKDRESCFDLSYAFDERQWTIWRQPSPSSAQVGERREDQSKGTSKAFHHVCWVNYATSWVSTISEPLSSTLRQRIPS